MPDVKYNIIPKMHSRSNPTPAQQQEEIDRVNAMINAGLIKENAFDGITVVANALQWRKRYGFVASIEPGKGKTWWTPNAIEAIVPAYNADGSWATVPNDNDSIPSFALYGREQSDFYKRYRTHFSEIPVLVSKVYSAEEANTYRFSDGPTEDFPLARIVRRDGGQSVNYHLPAGIALKYMEDGNLAHFRMEEYRLAYPLGNNITVAPPPDIPDAIILAGVDMILRGSAPAKDKVAKLKEMFAAMQGFSPNYRPEDFEVKA